MRQRGFVFLPVILIVILVGAIGYFVYKNTQFTGNKLSQPFQTNNSANKQVGNLASSTPKAVISKIEKTNKTGWSKYTNQQGKFSISFPDKLQLIIDKPAISEKKESGVVTFCDEKPTDNFCKTAKVEILYGIPFIDGKGGGCIDEEKYITVLGREQYVCMGKNFLGGIFIKHPNNYSEVGFTIQYSNVLTKDEAVDILNSLEFTQ